MIQNTLDVPAQETQTLLPIGNENVCRLACLVLLSPGTKGQESVQPSWIRPASYQRLSTLRWSFQSDTTLQDAAQPDTTQQTAGQPHKSAQPDTTQASSTWHHTNLPDLTPHNRQRANHTNLSNLTPHKPAQPDTTQQTAGQPNTTSGICPTWPDPKYTLQVTCSWARKDLFLHVIFSGGGVFYTNRKRSDFKSSNVW